MTTARQIARLEDDNNSIQVGWARGEGADEFTAWLAGFEIDTDAAFRLLGLEDGAPKPFRHFGDVRPDDATSEYGGGSEAAYWWDLEDGRVLGIGTAGFAYLISADAEPPSVTIHETIENS